MHHFIIYLYRWIRWQRPGNKSFIATYLARIYTCTTGIHILIIVCDHYKTPYYRKGPPNDNKEILIIVSDNKNFLIIAKGLQTIIRITQCSSFVTTDEGDGRSGRPGIRTPDLLRVKQPL